MPDPVTPVSTPKPKKPGVIPQNPLVLQQPNPMPVGQNYGADRFYLEQLRRMQAKGQDISQVTPDVLGPQRIGYQPTFWEDPQRVARWHNAVQAAPQGWVAPDWLDTTRLAQAYNYFSMQNKNTPWTEWKYLNEADPGRQYLQNNLQVPPDDYLWPQDKGLAAATIASVQRGETAWSTLSQGQRKSILTDPAFDMAKWNVATHDAMMADASFDWSRLPWWQKPAHDILSNPIAAGVVQSLPMAALAGLGTGGPGAVVPLALGALGGAAQMAPQGSLVNNIGSDLLSGLSWPSQMVEQVAGTLGQVGQSLINPEKYGDISQILGSAQKLKAAYQASRSAEEGLWAAPDIIANPLQMLTALSEAVPALFSGTLTPEKAAEIIKANPVTFMNPDGSFAWGKVWQIGVSTPQQAPEITEVMAQTRNAIVAGADPVETVNRAILQYGFTGTERDLLVKMVADPLNFLPLVINRGLANEISGKTLVGQTLLGKAIETTFGPAAETALRDTRGLTEAGRRYSSIIRTTPDAAEGLSGIARFVAGVTTDGKIRAGVFSDKQALLDKPTDLVGKRGFINFLGTLTPDERAITGHSLAQDNLRAMLWQFNDPAEATKFMRAVGSGDMETAAAMSKALVGTPEFYTILPVLKDFAANKMPDLLAVWEASRDKRAMLNSLADAMNIKPAALLDGLENTKDAIRSFEQLKQKLTGMDTTQAKSLLGDIQAGRFTAENMKSITDLFTGKEKIPWNIDLWNGMVGAALDDHFANWAKTYFNLKVDSPYFRFAHALKAAQGILLMGGNPAYAIRNTINDIVTRAAAGVGGFMTPKTINGWMERFGVKPYRFEEGVGMVGEPTKLGEPVRFEGEGATSRMVSDIHTGGKGIINTADRALRNTGSKMPFTKLSSWVEGMESKQAFAIGMRKMWGRLWNRGAGFSRMDPELTQALTAIDPRAPDLVYAAIEAGMNRGEIETALRGQQAAIQSRSLVNNAAANLGIAPRDAAMMLEALGVTDKLDILLQKAHTPSQISNAFRNTDRYVQDQIEIARARDLPARSAAIADRIRIEGAPAAADIAASLIEGRTQTWLEHYITFGDVFEKLDQIPQASMRDRLFRDARLTNMERWTKANAWEITETRGIMEGLGWDRSQESIEFMRSMEEVNRGWNETYKAQFDDIDAFNEKYRNQWDNPARWDEYEILKRKWDASFLKMFSLEHDGMVTQGDAMAMAVALRYGDAAGAVYAKGWADVVRFRDAMVARVQKFRAEAAGMKYEQRQAAKAQFYQHEYPAMIVQFGDVRKTFGEDLQAAIQGRPPRAPEAPRQAQTELITQEAAAEVARYDAEALAEERNIAKIASDHSFPTADATGRPLPDAKLDLIKLVRRYGGTKGAYLRTWKDLAAHPEIVELAFANREAYIRGQPMLIEPATGTHVTRDDAISIPRGQLPEDVSNTIYAEARTMLDDIRGSEPGTRGGVRSQVEEIQLAAHPSNYPDWYRELVNGTGGDPKTSGVQIQGALDKIIRDAGADKGVVVQRIKEIILDHVAQGDYRMGIPPDLNVLKILGATDEEMRLAARVYEDITGTPPDPSKLLVRVEPPIPPDATFEAAYTLQSEARIRAESNKAIADAKTSANAVIKKMTGVDNDAKTVFDQLQDESTQPAPGAPVTPAALFETVDPRVPFGEYDKVGGQLYPSQVLQEGWEQQVKPLLQAMEDVAINRSKERPLQIGGADDATQAALARYLNKVYQDMAGAKLQTIRWGESQRDNALLNYSRRYGFDKYLDVAYPYQFWYTRSMMNWGMRVLDRPAWFSNYARLRMAQNTFTNNLPERLRGKIAIPVPFLPKWMGNTLYIDPWSTFFPPDQFAQPLRTMASDQNTQAINASRLIQEWAVDGTIGNADAQQALQTQSGPTWDKAMAQAAVDREAEISSPFDFMKTAFGPAWYLSTPLNLMGIKFPGISTGKVGDIGVLPLTKTAQAAQAVTQGTWAEPIGDILGIFAKPEEWARKATGLPQNGEFGDYYIDRQLANMVADGEITPQNAQLAMMERTGPAFDAASQRVKLELAVRTPGAATLYAIAHGAPIQQIAASVPVSAFGAGILPAGELKFRGLTDEWNSAWDKYNAGDKEAVNQFFDEHPEYEVYKAKSKTPEERLRNFLVGQVWDSYIALDTGQKRMVEAQIGDLFNTTFLDKETRDYSAIDIESLAFWSRYLGGLVPKVKETQSITDITQLQMPAPVLLPPSIDVQLKSYEAERNSRFPGILDIQSMYYGLSESKRDAFLVNFPQLNDYRNWRKQYISSHPDLRPFIDTYYAQDVLSGKVDASQETKSLLKFFYSSDYRDPLFGAKEYLQDASSILWEQIWDYKLFHKSLSAPAMTELRLIWEAAGKPAGTLPAFLEDIIISTLQ